MNAGIAASVVAGLLLSGVWLGIRIRRLVPEHHLSPDTRDTVKLAMGLVATMTALVLGLLVSSAKSSYDTTRSEVIQMAAKVAFLNRVLTAYGDESVPTRADLRVAVEQAVGNMWSAEGAGARHLAFNSSAGDSVYVSIQNLSPKSDIERSLKSQALSLAVELGQLRTLLLAQMVSSISKPLLIVVVAWLFVIFLSFSLLAPPNATAALSLTAAALSVSGAIFLIVELDQPLGGFISVPSQPVLDALSAPELGTHDPSHP